MSKGVTFAVTVALDRARGAKEARYDFVRHLSPGEVEAYFRQCKAELGLERLKTPAPEARDEEFRR